MSKMQWSKLKRNVESLFADSVKGRVGLHSTRYRTMHDHDGRAWITLDGIEIINMTHIWQWFYELKSRAASLAGDPNYRNWEDYKRFEDEAEKQLGNESFFTQSHLAGAMHEYQSMSISEITASQNPIIRAIGMLDRRLGVRSLKKIKVNTEHPLVKATYLFRCQAEGIVEGGKK